MASRLAPHDARLRRDLGVALSRLGRTDEAVAELQEARTLAPEDAAVANALGTAYARAGRFPEAVGAFEEAVRIDPASEMARQNLEAARAACPPPCGPSR
jgi:Flp pilus assembly protein TadD